MLDLFAGLGGWSAAFEDRGHEVVTVDLDPRFGCTMTADVLKLRAADLPGPWDLVLASPPCEGFTMMNVHRNWTAGKPSSAKARLGIDLVVATLRLLRELRPRAWIMENPRAMMRTLSELRGLERRTVTYCQYGAHYQKPTDLWGGFPPTLRLHPPCKRGAPCHEPAKRGSRTGGVQALSDSARRAVVPYALSMAVCMAMENWSPGPPAGQARLWPATLSDAGESSCNASPAQSSGVAT